jgi:ankyrin repeat protein
MLNNQLIQQCKAGNIDAVKSLIAGKADVNAVTDGCTPLLLAIEASNLSLLSVLLQAGADITYVSVDGKSPLMIFSRKGRLDIVQCILQHQPPVLLDATDEFGHTALILALNRRNVDVASSLLHAGADATLRTVAGVTTLMVCSDVALAERLLDKGVNIHAEDASGRNALLHAFIRNNLDVAFLLLSRGATGYLQNPSTLVRACEAGHTELAMMMLRRGPPVGRECVDWKEWLNALSDTPFSDENSALHIAVRGGHVSLVQALVDAGCDVNIQNGEDAPPLHLAADVEVARILLDAGARDLRSDDGATAVSLACEDPARIEVLRLLLQRFPDFEVPDHDFSPLLVAADYGNFEAVRLLLDTRPVGYIDTQDFDGFTALHVVHDLETTRLLLEFGADPRIVDHRGRTPLMMSGSAASKRLLLEASPGLVGMRDCMGRTAVMHLSCNVSRFEALEELLRYCEERGLDAGVNKRDHNGDTALHFAMVGGTLRSVRLLLKNGADVLASGYEGTTVLMKPFLERKIVSSAYKSLEFFLHLGADYSKDASSFSCLQGVMDAVLLRGGGVGSVHGGEGGAEEAVEEQVVKRRRIGGAVLRKD